MDAPSALHGEPWDLASEYPSAEAPEVEQDLAAIAELLGDVEGQNATLRPFVAAAPRPAAGLDSSAAAEPLLGAAKAAFGLLERARRLLRDLGTYADCSLSVDSQDAPAQRLLGRLQAVSKQFAEAEAPLKQFLELAPDEVVDAYLADDRVSASGFEVRQARKRRHERLPLEQETLAAALGQDGIHAWGRLYDQLNGALTCTVEVDGEARRMGLAAAGALMLSADDALRERAWRAVNQAWEGHSETCAAAINAIAGWRLEMCRRRGRGAAANHAGRTVHFLDAPRHANRVEPETLRTVLGVAEEGRELARRAARAQARAYGKERYGPWDLRAPAPPAAQAADGISYRQAIDIVAEAFGEVDARMGEFVTMMAKRRWIEGTVGDRKRPGAYCAGFRKSASPRVYMTYSGGLSDVIVLAHELGHAFHAWVMRDLPDCQRAYGMAIAESASTFGEATVRAALLGRTRTPAERLAIVWQEAAAVSSFLLNIPARFTFERGFYEARAERPQRPDELKARMSAAWEEWYGDSLAEPDPMFWASKLHFYISDLSFYNFPYLFGYLFSLGVHARRDEWGDAFFPRLVALLRDTGRMTAEELAARHLQVDLARPDFWRETLARLRGRVDHFEALVAEAAG